LEIQNLGYDGKKNAATLLKDRKISFIFTPAMARLTESKPIMLSNMLRLLSTTIKSPNSLIHL
jgi:hypothetical protein